MTSDNSTQGASRRKISLFTLSEGVSDFKLSLIPFFHAYREFYGPNASFMGFRRRVFGCEFEERDGLTPETAIVIHGTMDEPAGIAAEYLYLADKYGVRGESWELEAQSVGETNGRSWDKMDIKLSDGTTRTLFFDITEFHGRR